MKVLPVQWSLFLSMMACVPDVPKDTVDNNETPTEDIDGDGWTIADGDCWESSEQPFLVEGALEHDLTAADIYPGAPDVWYDGIDSNCDGLDDFDQDQDGYVPDVYEGIETLGFEGSGMLPAGDCLDEDATIHPNAEEIPVDFIDSDCDGSEICFVDADGDGYGSDDFISTSQLDCQGQTISAVNGDCEPNVGEVYPNQVEWCDGVDSDCDGVTPDEEFDWDGDGFISCTIEGSWLGDFSPLGGDDCDDDNPDYFPGQTWYNDVDGDGYGTSNGGSLGGSVERCEPTSTFTALEVGDCALEDDSIHPYAAEWDDALDRNCDGLELLGYTDCTGTIEDGHYFMSCGHALTVAEATNLCQNQGYDGLASVLSENENTVLVSQFHFLANGIWLGASDARSENAFSWENGESLQYTNWAGTHPNVNGAFANCVTMKPSGLWEEVSCNQGFTGFSCMRRDIPVQ